MHNIFSKDTAWNFKNIPFLFGSLNLVLYILHIQTLVVSAFNKQTLQNAHDFLVNNKDNVIWEVNESGFVRTRFPMEILDFDGDVIPTSYRMNVSLRCNFWYGERLSSDSLKDAAAHDHPNGFVSYIVAHGYSHEIYQILSRNSTLSECPPGLIQDKAIHCTTLSIFNKKRSHVTHNGTLLLRSTDIQHAKADDVVIFDDYAIHRILNYQKNALTLNVVQKNGKGKTHILLFPGINEEVKQTRVVLKEGDALPITEKAITLYQEAISRLEKTEHHQKRIFDYRMKENEVWFSSPQVHEETSQSLPVIGL